MKLSPAEEYGLRCIVYLAEKHGKGLVTVEEISKHEGLSMAYVEKLLLQLKKSGLVTSTRGQSGGYLLAKTPQSISVGSVLKTMDGTILTELCDRFPGEGDSCVHLKKCQIRPIWVILAHHLYQILDKVSLADLIVNGGESQVRNELYSRFPVTHTPSFTW